MVKTSRKKGFHKLSLTERQDFINQQGLVNEIELNDLINKGGLTDEQASHMIENVIGQFSLPLGVALNFIVNGREVLIPMVVEEPSIVAGASFMAKLARDGGGFIAKATESEMIGQIQVLDIDDIDLAKKAILDKKDKLLKMVENVDLVLKRFGGGPRDLEVRVIEESAIGRFLVVHLIYDVRDAMGANAVNTACERLAPEIEEITGGRVHLKILSNLADRRLVKTECKIPLSNLAFGDFSGEEVRDGIIEAWAFADADPYRAATHNKGIMNGIDAVVLATGNDWRAIEAGAHSYAARSGKYTSLSKWWVDDEGNLRGSIELPMAVGIVGGATKTHPTARAVLKLMELESASQLGEIIASVGLAQNLAAIRALATEGIQRGHMTLHAKQVAISAGAKGEMIDKLAKKIVEEKEIKVERAQEILELWSIND